MEGEKGGMKINPIKSEVPGWETGYNRGDSYKETVNVLD